jgi:hypothetical protein
MDKYEIKGIKKLRSLTRTKIRLAEEAGTVRTISEPLPLVKFLSNREIRTIKEAKDYREELGSDYNNAKKAAKDVLEMMDIIEGVKYGFEPKELMMNLSFEDLKKIERKASDDLEKVTLLMMGGNVQKGPTLFIGKNTPRGARFLSGVPTSVAGFLDFAFHSDYFWDGARLKNIRVIMGHQTLILDAICFALGEFGAEGICVVPWEVPKGNLITDSSKKRITKEP